LVVELTEVHPARAQLEPAQMEVHLALQVEMLVPLVQVQSVEMPVRQARARLAVMLAPRALVQDQSAETQALQARAQDRSAATLVHLDLALDQSVETQALRALALAQSAAALDSVLEAMLPSELTWPVA
jgi:hypothetical protein